MRMLVNGIAAQTGGGTSVLRGIAAGFAESSAGDATFLVQRDLAGRLPAGVRTEVVRSPPTVIGRALWEQLRLPAIVRSGHYDALLALSNVAPLRRSAVPIGVLVQNIAPLDRRIRALHPPLGRARLEALHRLTIASVRAADVVFALSQACAEAVAEASGTTRPIIVVAPGLRPCGSSPPFESSRNQYVLMVGDLYRYKGVEDAIEAIADPRLQQVQLVVVGRPVDRAYDETLRSLAAQVGVGDRVRMEGAVPNSEISSYLAGATALVQASRCESLALPVYEAQVCGTPVVASDIPALREAALPGTRLYRAGDTAALADALSELVSSPERVEPRPPRSWSGAAAQIVAAISASG